MTLDPLNVIGHFALLWQDKLKLTDLLTLENENATDLRRLGCDRLMTTLGTLTTSRNKEAIS